MSITFINDFQKQIYQILSEDAEISASVSKIYFGAVQDGKCPFLLISIQEAEELSLHVAQIYSVEFQISAYAKDHHHKLLTSLADRVVLVLNNTQILFNDFGVAGIKANKITFEKAKDLVLNKLSISYKALIRRKNNE